MSRLKRLAQLPLSKLSPTVVPPPSSRVARDVRRRYERALEVHPRRFRREVGGLVFEGSTEDFIQRHVYAYGVWEPSIDAVFRDTVRPGDAVLDVGANWGYFTLVAANLVGATGAVLAVEALPSMHAALCGAVERNGFSGWVRTLNVAAGAEPGSLEMFRGTPDNLGNSTSTAREGYVSEGAVDVVCLDDELPDEFVSRLALVKIDTEGAEERVLAGMPETLKRLRPGARVLVEVTPDMLAEQGGDASAVLGHFPAEEWEAFRIENDYEPAAYMSAPVPPIPYEGPVVERADMMFVKRAAAR